MLKIFGLLLRIKMIRTLENIKKNKILIAFGINVLLLGGLLIFFQPVIKSDDYYMSEICYGSVSGNSDVHLVYNSIILGYILKFLLGIFPEIPWYVIIQIVCVFFAFFSLTYFFIRSSSFHTGMSIGLLLVVFGYECYVKITFTKTSAILLGVGVFLVFSEYFNRRQELKIYILGLVNVCVGILFRNANVNMVLGIMIIIGISEILASIINKRKKYFYIRTFFFLSIVFLIFSLSKASDSLNKYMYSLNEEWTQYYDNNHLKSQILDYTENNYELYEEEYENIGVSKNDLALIYSNDMYDTEFLSEKKIESILSIANKDRNEKFIVSAFQKDNIIKFFRKMPLAYIKTPCFIVLFVFMLVILLQGNTREKLWGICTIIMVLAANYYLFLKGRMLQPHVDVGIIFSACLVLLYFLMNMPLSLTFFSAQKRLSILTGFILCCNTIIDGYDSITAPYFLNYGSENACNPQKSREIMDILTEDKENLYVTTSKESVYSKWSFDTFEVIPKGYFGNIYSLGSALWPSQKVSLEKYNVKNVYKELVDSDYIYFFVSDDLEESGTQGIQTYINEHYDSNAKMIKVKEFQSMNVYRCISDELIVQELPHGTGSVKSDLKILTDGTLMYIDGYCYVEDSNSYNQDMYIEVLDSESNRKYYYNTLQKENSDIKDNMNGRFSKVETYLEAQEYWSEEDEVSILLHADGYSYRIPLEME